MMNLGDFLEDTTNIGFTFTSRSSAGTPTALSSALVDVYKISSTTPTTAGVTITSTFAGVVGLNRIQVNADSTAFYAAQEEYSVILSQGEVGSIDVAGETLAHFSIENRGSTQKVIDALTAHGVTTLNSTQVTDAATTALETYGASTIGSTHVEDACTTALEQYGASTLGSTHIEDAATTALEQYGPSTFGSTQYLDIVKDGLSTYGVTTLNSTQVTDAATTALETYGASTLGSTHIEDAATTALEQHGASTLGTTHIFDQAKNALSTANLSTATSIMTAAQTEAYSTATNPSVANMLFGIQQMLMNFAINSTILTVHQIGTTSSTAMTFELNDSTAPTAIKRTG